MSWLHRLVARIKYRHFDRDLREELAGHQAMAQSDREAEGATKEAARRQAHRDLGNVTLAREAARGVWIPTMIENVWRDVRYAVRSLAAHPGFTLTSLVTLVIAIGLNASLFTVFSVAYFRPWPVSDASRVFVASLVPRPGTPDGGRPGVDMSYAEYQYVRDHARSVDLLAFQRNGLRVQPGVGDDFEAVQVNYVSENFFEVLGLPLRRGAGFSIGATSHAGPVVVISDSLWRGLLASDPNIVGRVVRLSDVAATIVGVAPPQFVGLPPRRVDVYIPLSWMHAWHYEWIAALLNKPADNTINVAGRVRAGWTRAQAQAELSTLHRQFPGTPFSTARDIAVSGTAPGQIPGGMGSNIPVIFALLFGACALVLLLACANVGNLQLARSFARQREIAIRLSLGASRPRVIRQLLTESLLLSTVAGVLALGVAWMLPSAILSFDPSTTSVSWTPDLRVLGFSLALCVLTSIVFGLTPALKVTRHASRAASSLKARGASASGGRLRSLILAVQVAISMVLLISATLLVRGLMHVISSDLGFSVRNIEVATISVPTESYTAPQMRALSEGLRASGLAMAFCAHAPLDGATTSTLVKAVDQPAAAQRRIIESVSAGYFDVLRIPLVAGRVFADDPSRREAVINEALARTLWPDGRPVGRELRVDDDAYEVTGVVKDARTANLDQVDPIVYFAWARSSVPVVLVANADVNVVARLQAIATRVDPHLKVAGSHLSDTLSRATGSTVIGAGIASGLGLLALGLATVGVFGVFGYLVEERRREIGIRLALGARGPQVVRLILAKTRRATVGGLAAGLMLAGGASFVLRSFLYGLSPLDPTSYVVVALILTAAATLATYVPARRAARVDPAVTLRSE